MSQISLPYPGEPATGSGAASVKVRENIAYLVSILQSLPGDNLQAKSVAAAALADAINPELRDGDMKTPFIIGGIPSGFTGLQFTIPSGVSYNLSAGKLIRNPFSGSTLTVNINKDTYYAISSAGSITAAQEVANGAASPALAAGAQWNCKVVSGASAIIEIITTGFDSAGNPIHNINPYLNQAKFSGVQAYRTTVHNIPNAAWTVAAFDAEEYDTDGYHSTSSNTSRLTAPVAGYYMVTATVRFAANATGGRQVSFMINGDLDERLGGQGGQATSAAGANNITSSMPIKLNAGDYIELRVFQDSGGGLNMEADGGTRGSANYGLNRFSLTRLGV